MFASTSISFSNSYWCWIPFFVSTVRFIYGKFNLSKLIHFDDNLSLPLQFATRHFTYRLPSINENPKKLFQVYKKMTRPLTMFLTVALGIHTLAAMALTQKEILDCHRLQQEIINEELLS